MRGLQPTRSALRGASQEIPQDKIFAPVTKWAVRVDRPDMIEEVMRLIGNKRYRRYVRMEKEALTIDKDKITREERHDGKWVLTTNTSLRADYLPINA